MPLLSLLFSPLGRWLLVAAGIALTYGVGYYKGHAAADRAAELATVEADLKRARAEQAEAVRQALAASRLARDAAERQRAAEATAMSLQTEVENYVAELEARKDRACFLRDGDVARLRSLARSGAGAPRPPERPADLR